MLIELEQGGFYTCIHEDHDPVAIWVGRIDLPEDLEMGAPESVVSLIVRTTDPDALILNHAPFWESAVLGGELMAADPFEVDEDAFADNYNVWRSAFDTDEAQPWDATPNEIYAQMVEGVLEGTGA